MIEIRLAKEQNMKGYTLLEAYPGVGLVGAMAGSYIIEKLKMNYIGWIESDQFPPIAAIHNTVPLFPARIYRNDEYKIILFMAEFTIPSQLIYQLSQAILSFARKYGISKIVSVGGLPAQKPGAKIYVASSDNDILKMATKLGIKPVEDGVIAGVSATLLAYSKEYNMPMLDILVEVNPAIMDPKYAELAITGLNKLLNMNIDLEELHKEAKYVEAKIRELMKKVKDHQQSYEGGEQQTSDQSMYA